MSKVGQKKGAFLSKNQNIESIYNSFIHFMMKFNSKDYSVSIFSGIFNTKVFSKAFFSGIIDSKRGSPLYKLFGAGLGQKGVGGFFLKIRPHSCV